MKRFISIFFVFLGVYAASAQDIFKQHGFTKEPLTLSNGKYKEFFENQTLVQIGTVLLNTVTNEIVAFVSEDTSEFAYSADLASRWLCPDPLSEMLYEVSPYNYVRNNPIVRIDPNGKWDVTVHLYNNRSSFGYGIAVVSDRQGNEVFRYIVRAQGIAGSNRTQENADTPLGIYDIPNNSPWITGANRTSYGPNSVLNMNEMSGEIISTGRGLIRIHGGRQEIYDSKTKRWTPDPNAQLSKTQGCLRAYDEDMAKFKQITDNLQANDNQETPGQVRVYGDLEKDIVPTKDNKIEVDIHYQVPDSEKGYWQQYVNDFLNRLKLNNNQGGK